MGVTKAKTIAGAAIARNGRLSPFFVHRWIHRGGMPRAVSLTGNGEWILGENFKKYPEKFSFIFMHYCKRLNLNHLHLKIFLAIIGEIVIVWML